MRQDFGDLVGLLGHLHPMLVHLPIGGLVLLVFLELSARFPRWKGVARNSGWILGFVCATSLVSVGCGLMLARSGGYDAQLLKWHQAAGLGLTATLLVAAWFRHLDWTVAYRGSLVGGVALLAIAGHLGGSITHGRDYLTRYLPRPLRASLGPASDPKTIATCSAADEQSVFAEVIEPVLREHCLACHGPEKHKADLRLDSLEQLLRGGQDGPVILLGQAKHSPLIQCVVSPLDADGHMPPEGQAQLTAHEITLLEWWVNHEAPARESVNDLKPGREIRPN